MATLLTESIHAGEFLLTECCDGSLSREAVTIEAGAGRLPAGQVLGKITRGTVTVGNPTFAGTGNGTLAKSTPAYGTGVQAGDYKVVCVEKTTDSGLFEVLRPDGSSDGFATVGTGYDGQIRFTLADGTTDFAQGAAFAVPVAIAAGSGRYVAYDPEAGDGSETAAALLYAPVDATDADQLATVIARHAEAVGELLTGLDDAARESLARNSIIVR